MTSRTQKINISVEEEKIIYLSTYLPTYLSISPIYYRLENLNDSIWEVLFLLTNYYFSMDG